MLAPVVYLWVGAWYLCSILANNSSKLLLGSFALPITVTLVQVAVGGAAGLVTFGSWAAVRTVLQQHWRPAMASSLCIIAVGVFHRISLLYLSVSVVHIIKACQVFFSMVLSWAAFGEHHSRDSMTAIALVVGGVLWSTAAEGEYSLPGLAAAVFSTAALSTGNIITKHMMSRLGLDRAHVVGITNVLALPMVVLLWLMTEAGALWVDGWTLLRDGGGLGLVAGLLLLIAVSLTAQQYIALGVLKLVTPVTYAVFNTFKRVVVIIVAVVYFSKPLTLASVVGTLVSTGGMLLYSRAKRAAAGGGGLGAVGGVDKPSAADRMV